ncbi:hypothetical protein HPB49_011043 [Dermacentor silvarum]|uniref:Uncharacterized protein n=1 Tax=Dermacentor silvarum TaxID=543639 RepID=A0ACB8CKL9_DERSI|nr:hypothetical protein HPB49_011043 [Dermacentor silvarum]
MDSQDDGDDLAPEGFGKDSAWITVAKRRVCKNAAARLCANSSAAHPDGQDTLPSRNRYKDAKSKILRGSKMPPLPKHEMKIVVRPRGGLSITKAGPKVVAEAIWAATGISTTEREWDTMCPNPMQNVMVISTSSHEHAVCYTAVENITVAGQQHEVNAYVAAPHAICKGVIRRIAIEDGPEVIDQKIVNRRNPLALGAKRIKDTGTVVVLFEGYKVPNYVAYGGTLIRCTLFRKQMDVCYTCGRLGHRSDVCPSPEEVVCRGCGVPIPMNNTAATQNASYAARPTSPQLRIARNASRCRTWFDAEEENALATLSRRKDASHHHPSRMINTFQLSPVKGTHALKNWTHRPHPAPEAPHQVQFQTQREPDWSGSWIGGSDHLG